MADASKIEQVLNNLISNAVKFSHSGSEVVVLLQRQDESVLLRVVDRGVGIPVERLQSIFQPFGGGASGTAGEKSTGLGLAIVKRIVEGHGGKIWVESVVGQGATFAVRLPVDPEPTVVEN